MHSNLIWADLNGADLNGADLAGAYLNGADLAGANLAGAYLGRVDFAHSRMSMTIFGDVDLSEAVGLETVDHGGPSTIGIDSIFRSKGKIPEIFLRGVGVPEGFITFMKSLVVNPIEYYSCSISYSSRNEEFAKRLHADLQAVHVRCWFAPEDLKIGEKFRPKIDEAIRLHDKLLLVLSKSSVASPWVETEVESAFEREHKERRIVLFPIRLDDAVMETNQAWAADIRRTRHIGDFSEWEDHDRCQKGFARLLRDLKADDKADKKESV
jgi:TIR domain/Pentapeptide repeats (8 copies)